MANLWQTVRVFISSTFRDMHSERDWLVKRVFPALRERLEKYRVHLIDIDLRWGVTEQQAESGGALDVCLDQIDACRPFFLGLLGERYGWVPQELPERVTSKYGWIQHTTKKSITELEILYGVLNDPEMSDHSFFCYRDPAFIEDVPTEKQSDLRAEDDESAEKLRALKSAIERTPLPTPPLKGYHCEYAGLRINWRLATLDLSDADRQAMETLATDGLVDPAEYIRLEPHFRDLVHRFATVQLAGLEDFGERVKNWLWESICDKLNLSDQPPMASIGGTDPLAEEADFHTRYMESRTRVYVGREKVMRALTEFANGDSTVPCLVTGQSGSGKSAAIAQFVRSVQSQIENQKSQILLIPHFIGASPASTSLRQMLRRLCLTVKKEFGFAEEVEQETQRLIGQFKAFLGRVPADRRVLIALDALNQLDETDNADQLHWLPWEFPAHVKVIVSCIDDHDDGIESEPRPSGSGVIDPLPDGHGSQLLNELRQRKCGELRIEPLADNERLQILREVPSLSAKTLDDRQVRLLLKNPATQNPLFLLVALEELRGFGSFEQLSARIKAFPNTGDTVTALFIQVIERLEAEFGTKLTHSVLTLLASARRGLSEQELQELTKSEGRTDDLFAILRQLRPYLQPRSELLDFYHRNLFKAVRAKYLPTRDTRKVAHTRLGSYFAGQDYFLESPEEQRQRVKRRPATPRPVNVRKVDELLWGVRLDSGWIMRRYLDSSEISRECSHF